MRCSFSASSFFRAASCAGVSGRTVLLSVLHTPMSGILRDEGELCSIPAIP